MSQAAQIGGGVAAPAGSARPAITTAADVDRLFAGLAVPAAAGRRAGGRRARALFRRLGDPQEQFRSVHVAGTAGKGSVVALLAAVLRAHGHLVGAHLSPHVYSVLERFQIDGEPVRPEQLDGVVDPVAEAAVHPNQQRIGGAGYAELTMATAFELFAQRAVDYGLVEAGIGGRHDATNAIARPDKLAVLTSVGLDHTDVLGSTLTEIAADKADIFPAGGLAVVASGPDPDVDEVVAAAAAGRGCDLVRCTPDRSVELAHRTADGCWRGQYRGPAGRTWLAPSAPGRHQLDNALLAVQVAEQLAARDGWRLDAERASAAIAEVRLPGRFERRSWHGCEVVLDGAHNPDKLSALADAVRGRYGSRHSGVWVLAMAADKNVDAGVAALAGQAAALVATETVSAGHGPSGARAVPASTIAEAATTHGVPLVETMPDPRHALTRACALAAPGCPVVVTGSFRLLGQVAPEPGDPGTGPLPGPVAADAATRR